MQTSQREAPGTRTTAGEEQCRRRVYCTYTRASMDGCPQPSTLKSNYVLFADKNTIGPLDPVHVQTRPQSSMLYGSVSWLRPAPRGLPRSFSLLATCRLNCLTTIPFRVVIRSGQWVRGLGQVEVGSGVSVRPAFAVVPRVHHSIVWSE